MLTFKTILLVALIILIILAVTLFIAMLRKIIKDEKESLTPKSRQPKYEDDFTNSIYKNYVETKEKPCKSIYSNDYRPFNPISAYLEMCDN